jgi:hypothetical protein
MILARGVTGIARVKLPLNVFCRHRMLILLLLTNIAATIAFAISGALVAARHRLDIVGFIYGVRRTKGNLIRYGYSCGYHNGDL